MNRIFCCPHLLLRHTRLHMDIYEPFTYLDFLNVILNLLLILFTPLMTEFSFFFRSFIRKNKLFHLLYWVVVAAVAAVAASTHFLLLSHSKIHMHIQHTAYTWYSVWMFICVTFSFQCCRCAIVLLCFCVNVTIVYM